MTTQGFPPTIRSPDITASLKVSLNTIRNVIKVVLSLIGTSWKKIWSSIKSFTVGLWNVIKGIAKSTWDSVKKSVLTPINTIKQTASRVWSQIKSTASSAWTGIKNAILSPITSAKDKISGILSSIKGMFPLSVGKIFSNLQLPHITVSGGKAPFGIGGKGKLPSFDVKWFASAMKNGMILNSPTIFGAMNGSLLAGGEVGKEAVVGTDSLMSMITNAVAGMRDDIVNALHSGSMGTVINNYITVNGAESPESYARRLISEMELQIRTV